MLYFSVLEVDRLKVTLKFNPFAFVELCRSVSNSSNRIHAKVQMKKLRSTQGLDSEFLRSGLISGIML